MNIKRLLSLFLVCVMLLSVLASCKKDIVVAVMGCIVNGPGEARNADYGIAGGRGEGVIFRRGEVVEKVSEDRLVDRLMELIESEN